MEEFFDLEGSTGIVELYIAAELTGLSMDELRASKNYIVITNELPEFEEDYGFQSPVLDTDWEGIRAIYHIDSIIEQDWEETMQSLKGWQ